MNKQPFTSAVFVVLVLVLSLSYLSSGQEVPKGVTYKRAPDSVNASVKAALEKALASDSFPAELLKDIFTCGPMLWKSLKPSADPVLLESKVVVGFVSTPEPAQVEARGLITEQQRQSFWAALLKAYPKLKSAKVRATANEILFYWATIPFDIDEPFFAIDTGTEVFVVHFGSQAPALFWIDLVGDLSRLKNSKAAS